MKVLVDENMPHTTVDHLRELGHDVKDIRGTADQGLADSNLWALAMSEGRLLITTDKGFTEFRRMAGHHGILVVRLRQPNRRKIHYSVMHAMGRFQEGDWPGLLVVMRDATMSTSRADSTAQNRVWRPRVAATPFNPMTVISSSDAGSGTAAVAEKVPAAVGDMFSVKLRFPSVV